MFVCVFVFLFMCVFVFVCVCVPVCVCLCLCLCLRLCVHVCDTVCMCVCVSMCVCMHVCMYCCVWLCQVFLAARKDAITGWPCTELGIIFQGGRDSMEQNMQSIFNNFLRFTFSCNFNHLLRLSISRKSIESQCKNVYNLVC